MARKKLQAKIRGRPTALGLRFDRTSAVPLYRQVYERLRDLVARGGFGPGARLPSSRSLASQLSLSRATVAYAYDLLAGDGYVGGRGQAGTYVSPLAAPDALEVAGTRQTPEPVVQRLFAVGLPALDQFPRKTWARLEKRRAGALTAADLVAPDPRGYLPLRRTLANRLAITRGIVCDPDQVFITAGYAGALMLAATSTVAPRDAAWVEDPGDPAEKRTLQALRVRIVGVPVDAQGINVSAGIRRAPAARLALVTPCHQFPLGAGLSSERRGQLLAWARKSGAWILEHDRDNDFHYLGQPALPLKSRDPADRVIYVASFDSVLFPALGLACAVVPKPLVQAFTAAAEALGCAPATREQAVLREFVRRGFIGQHVNRMRRLYAARRQALVAALSGGRALRIEVPEGGLHVLAWLRRGGSDTAAAARVHAQGLGAEALSSLSISERLPPALLLGFAALEEGAAESAASRLLDAIEA